MSEKIAMFSKYPDVVEVNQLRERCLAASAVSWPINFWQIMKYEVYESDELIKFPRLVLLNICWAKKCATSRFFDVAFAYYWT